MKAEFEPATLTCPACRTPLQVPVTARMTGPGTAAVAFDLSAAQAHWDSHTHAPADPAEEGADAGP